MLQMPIPRVLPLTIAALGALLAVKSAGLVRAAVAALAPDSPAAALVTNHAISGKPGAPPSAAPLAAPAAAADAPEAAPVSDAERSVLLELRQRRQELDARELAMTARESVLAAAEQKLSARVEELGTLQKKLEALEAGRHQREEAGWQGLVKMYEAMRPRDAATIFNDLDLPVLLPVLDRMKEAKAAPILAAMTPDKARETTMKLAELRTRRETPTNFARGGN